MQIETIKHKVSELVEGYENKSDGQVSGFNGLLNIRPAYQREFVYNLQQQRAVINTVLKGYPLNSMYWVNNSKAKESGTMPFEVLDGQQRTISICEFVKGNDGKGSFAIVDSDGKMKHFSNLSQEKQQKILDYEVSINLCTGSNAEKMEWFKTINIAGEKLTEQEIRNAVYSGPWVNDAKAKFSKDGCPAETSYKAYLAGDKKRQDWLETVIEWMVELEEEKKGSQFISSIDEYMDVHQSDRNANNMWIKFSEIMAWITITFISYRKEMKGLNWGRLYHQYGQNSYNSAELESKISELMENDEIVDKKGIYEYVLSGCDKAKERLLNLRSFSQSVKRSIYEKQRGYCVNCGKYFDIEEMQADHIVPWSQGGRTEVSNCQCLCKECNNSKSDK